MNERPPGSGWLANTLHSIWLRTAGFGLGFIGAGLIVVGTIVGFVGLAGGLLVRVRPDTTANINYDPSTVALLAPIPIVAGVVVLLLIGRITRLLGTSR